MDKTSKIYIAGHRGLVGSAILEDLANKGYTNIITKTHKELDLTNQVDVASFFEQEKPEYVILAAAKVGGIVANNAYRADFIYENMMIQNNVIHQSYIHEVKKLLFLGSTCIYPKNATQPMKEEYLLTDTLEYTNEPYAIAKIAGIKMCESYNLQYNTNFISVMPTNLYGPNDNFDLEKSHVLPALIRKIYLAKLLDENNIIEVLKDTNFDTIEEAKTYLESFGVSKESVEIWGSGKPKREFLWSKDMADACVFIMENRDFSDTHTPDLKEIRNTHINIGSGKEISIKELAETIKKIIGYKGALVFNSEKPDGTMRKLTDVSKLNNLGWKHTIELEEGIKKCLNGMLKDNLKIAIEASLKAGDAIMKIYGTDDFKIEVKGDNSPLTIADKTANDIINTFLVPTKIPIISEENKQTLFSVRKTWEECWIVDPVDGTKEFIKRNGEFTVNIALVRNGKPILGVIYVPVVKTIYYADVEVNKSYKATLTSHCESIEEIIEKSELLQPKNNKSNKVEVVEVDLI